MTEAEKTHEAARTAEFVKSNPALAANLEESEGVSNFGKFCFVDREEELEAKRLIEEKLGFEVPRVTGFQIAIRLYERETLGKDGILVTPETMKHMEKFRQCVGLVLNKGPDAYVGKRFENSGPWCRIGDWVTIPRNEGSLIMHRDLPVMIIPDDRVLTIVEDPEHVYLP